MKVPAWARKAPRGLEIPEPLWDVLAAAYASPGRAYHTLDHVREVVRLFHEVTHTVSWRHPREAFLALLFHDAVYEPGASDNEAKSVLLARETLARFPPGTGVDVDRVARLIELTARHGHLQPEEVDADSALFLDCDMAILGAEPEAYAAYETGIAQEYRALSAEVFAAGRRHFLERLLASPRIYLSEYFHEALEDLARRNLRAAVGDG